MADEYVPPAAVVKNGLRIAGNILAALWIGGGTAFFLLRFSTAFYRENTPAIEHLLDVLFQR